ncbi:conjugal transfer protein TrbH [Legionella nautarum]|uniref:Conjugal transfer protein TrbH n=1 Tax=Legionella nautarum TaxID=45070 RepID=A0A0W0X1Y0_9GAMM|nr:hypothetical protein [Legionella nautarum]KTD38608.1 conjugal transfer protein TrbH [Legionella nautarum]
MMKNLVLVLMLLSLSACTSMRYGNVSQMSEKSTEFIVKESLIRLVSLYPPAKTKLAIVRPRDNFGLKLIKALRQSGYSVSEGSNAKGAINFFYVMDAPIQNKLYRVTLYLGSKTLTRAYSIKKGTLRPLGLWTRQE